MTIAYICAKLPFRYLHPNFLFGLDGERWTKLSTDDGPSLTIRYQVHKETEVGISPVSFSFFHCLRSSGTSTSDAEEFLLSARLIIVNVIVRLRFTIR